ncbi:MAG: hypothetical protein DRP29_01260 [Thermodesulfobacteriota bacterium]|nr:MAG: hypothetical protein DRP29_01260 [Thermodesulfobacteriota bacterium]
MKLKDLRFLFNKKNFGYVLLIRTLVLFIIFDFVLFSIFGLFLLYLIDNQQKTVLSHLKTSFEIKAENLYSEYLFKEIGVSQQGFIKEEIKYAKKLKLIEECKRLSQSIPGIDFIILEENFSKTYISEILKKFYNYNYFKFEPLKIKILFGFTKKYTYKVLFKYLILFVYILSTLNIGFIYFLIKSYWDFRKPFENLIKNLKMGKKLSLTGYYEIDALVNAVNKALRKEKELFEKEKRLQQEMAVRDKMIALGTMAGGYAHEFNNLLHMILGSLELAELYIKRGKEKETEKYFSQIKQITLKGQELAKRLLYLTRTTHTEKTNLSKFLENLKSFTRVFVPREINVYYHIEPNLIVSLSEEGVKEIFINLLKNAIDAIENKKDAIEKKIFIRAYKKDEKVIFEIEDTGTGMTEEVKARIFDPFFTTKPVKEGTGLGMYLVYNIVNSAKGSIEINTILNKGTTIRIYLPLVSEKVEEKKSIEKEISLIEDKKSKALKILVVDDELIIRDTIKEFLDIQGYKVESAENGKTALEKLYKNGYDVCFLDMYMPDLTGKEVLQEIISKGKVTTKFILITGYGGEMEKILDEYLKQGILFKVLRKPFSLSEIQKVLKEILQTN